jgi:FMN phosphatase YigB (HAD superfamily)
LNLKLKDTLKAVLFDLDGTLIDVNLKTFIPDYLKLLSESVSHLIPPRKFISKLLKASEMVNNNDGRDTNENVYASAFFPIEGYSREEIEPFFDRFYENNFKKLKKHTSVIPEARKVVQTVFYKGYDVVIATTPVIPLTAIQQRLEWAGVGDFDYKLITSIENTYATKPNLLYFMHIFKFLGYSAEECIMIGDEHKDMVCKELGAQTFFIEGKNSDLNSETPDPTYRGKLIDLLNNL